MSKRSCASWGLAADATTKPGTKSCMSHFLPLRSINANQARQEPGPPATHAAGLSQNARAMNPSSSLGTLALKLRVQYPGFQAWDEQEMGNRRLLCASPPPSRCLDVQIRMPQ